MPEQPVREPLIAPGNVAEREIIAVLRSAGCVYAEDEARLMIAETADPHLLATWVSRRAAGEPLETIVGWTEFAGLRVAVAAGVFVPRRRTELLARVAALLAVEGRPERAVGAPILVELCCGAAPVSAVVAREAPSAELYAVDVDPRAVACAERNLVGRAVVLQGDLAEPLPDRLRGQVEILAANAPYVPSREIVHMPREAREREPRVALDGGSDGLEVQRRIVDLAPTWLRPGGRMLIETSESLVPGTAALIAAAGLAPRVLRDNEIGATVVVGEKPSES